VEYDASVSGRSEQTPYDCVMIGAGVRIVPSNFILFEQMVNVVHEHAPQARICFNQMPADIAEAVKRWL